MILPLHKFNAGNNFKLTVNQTGFYYLECKKLFSHVYAYRMSKLIEQNKVYRDYAEQFTAKFQNDSELYNRE